MAKQCHSMSVLGVHKRNWCVEGGETKSQKGAEQAEQMEK